MKKKKKIQIHIIRALELPLIRAFKDPLKRKELLDPT
jgi:hypothetical protein